MEIYLKLTCGICGKEIIEEFDSANKADEWWEAISAKKNFVCCNSYMHKTIHKDEK